MKRPGHAGVTFELSETTASFLLFAPVLCMNAQPPLRTGRRSCSPRLSGSSRALSSGQLLGPGLRGQRRPPERPREPRLRADGRLPLQEGLLPAGLVRLDLHGQWLVGPRPAPVRGYVRVMWVLVPQSPVRMSAARTLLFLFVP